MREYEIFATVVETGSLSAGGRKLGLSAAMISKRLARLEDRLGVRLLERNTRSLALTEAGRQFYARAISILDSIEEAEAMASGRDAAARGVLRISAPTSFGRLHIAPYLPDFLSDNSDLTVELNLTDSFVDLQGEGVDVAVRISPLSKSAHAVWLAPNRRVLCAAPAYLAKHGAPEDLVALRERNLLAAANQTPWRLEGPQGPIGVQVRSLVRTNSSELITALTVAGAGIALRSNWDISRELTAGRLQVVLPEYTGASDICIQAIRSSRRHASASATVFIHFLQRLYQPHPYWD